MKRQVSQEKKIPIKEINIAEHALSLPSRPPVNDSGQAAYLAASGPSVIRSASSSGIARAPGTSAVSGIFTQSGMYIGSNASDLIDDPKDLKPSHTMSKLNQKYLDAKFNTTKKIKVGVQRLPSFVQSDEDLKNSKFN